MQQESNPSNFIKIVLLIVQCILAGCASVQTSGHLEEDAQVLPVAINSPEGRIKLPYSNNEPALVVEFLVTGGGILGKNDEKRKILFSASQESLSLPSSSSIFSNILGDLRELELSSYPKIIVQPSETKIARISLMAFDRYLYENDFKRDIGYTSIVDIESGNALLPIAVDRPCHIVGSLSVEAEMAEFDVRFQSAGVYFLTVVPPASE